MRSFNQWREQVDPPIDTIIDDPIDAPQSNPTVAQTVDTSSKPEKMSTKEFLKMHHIKPWKASKDEIMPFWKTLNPGIPLKMKPISYDHKGSTMQEDAVRITGTKEFISSVISRLKDFIPYENPQTKLMVAYRQNPKSFMPGNKNSYIFYLQSMERGKSF
jgi:hypothetical protein